MEYRDFKITIGWQDQEGRHSVLIESPAGGFSGTFVNPISKEYLDNKLIESGLQVRSLEGMTDEAVLRDIGPVTSTNDLEDMGDQLSQALFQQDVLAAYAMSKGLVEGSGEGLRIRLRIDPNMDDYAELMSLPWEFLYDNAAQTRIELVPCRAVVRDPVVPAPPSPVKVKPPLRILVAISDPKDYPDLKLGKEMLTLAKVAEIESIEVRFLESATIQQLAREMSQQEYHIFHFMGHGGVDNQKSVLIFKGEDGNGFPVEGGTLKLALTDSVRLVFLNACETARIPEANPFTSIPTELLKSGISTVVAMQFPISDAAAIRFCKRFYGGLAEGTSVDQSMGEARKEIFFGADTQPEWGTPILFMNSPDGMLFEIEEESQAEET